MEQLDTLIFNAIESLRTNKKQPNEDTLFTTISKELTLLTKEQLNERLNNLLDNNKLSNKPHGGKNSYYKLDKDSTMPPETPLLRKELLTPIVKSKNPDHNISEKLKEYVKMETFETFYETFLEFRYFVDAKFESYKEENAEMIKRNEKQISLETKVKLLENEIKILRKTNEDLKDEAKSHIKIIESLAEGKVIDAPWQTSSSKNTKTNTPTTRKFSNVNSLPLHNSYEVLHIEENSHDQFIDKDTTERMQYSKKESEKSKSQSFKKVSGEWFARNGSNSSQNPVIVPGNRSFASATKYGKKVVVFGDSHIGRVNRKLFSNSLRNCTSRLKFFSGAKSKDLDHYVTPTLNEEKPDIVVIHVGSNDIDFRHLRNNTVEDIGRTIINIGKKCRESGVSKVIISSVLIKNNIKLSKFIRQLNDILKSLCLVNNFYFISNDNVTREHICGDGVHLTGDGTYILAGNFVDFINNITSF